MITSPLLKTNPNLYVFLPLFYMVWEDAVLTPSEIKKIREIIDLQDWLTNEERNFLLEQVNPASPPSPDELKNWLTESTQAEVHSQRMQKIQWEKAGESWGRLNPRAMRMLRRLHSC